MAPLGSLDTSLSQGLAFIVAACLLVVVDSSDRAVAQDHNVDFAVASGVTVGGAGTLPFWFHSNQSGRLDPTGTNAYLQLSANRSFAGRGWWSAGIGAEFATRISDHAAAYFNQLFAEFRVHSVKLRVGRALETIGTVDESLSMGSLATSSNATPLPKVVLQTIDYMPVPFTQGFASVKGYVSHAWFSDDRFVSHPYLHQKSLYVKLGNGWPVTAFGGLVHDAFWGGVSPVEGIGQLPDTADDFLRTVLGRGGSERAIETERVYVQGNHLGIYDFGLTARTGKYEFAGYRQFIFDDRDGLRFKNPEDGLLGFSASSIETNRVVNRVVYEYLYTKWQGGEEAPGPGRGGPGGRDNYYNHYIYRSGWSHHSRSLGNPLLLPYPNGEIRGQDRFYNNRIVAHHIGIAGRPAPNLTYRFLATYSRNYGTYADRERAERTEETYLFAGGLRQYSFLLETLVQLPTQVSMDVVTAVALDLGELYEDNLGLKIGVVYRGSK